MSEFRTSLPAPLKSAVSIGHQDAILCMGSCFATHMGDWLQNLKFSCLINPFGILYNPVSMGEGLSRLLTQEPYTASDLVQHGGLWHSFDHHGVFSYSNANQALQGINKALEDGFAFAQRANRLILTPGTALVYTRKESGRVAANCHKFPAADFEKRRLGVGEVVGALSAPIAQWKASRPDLEILVSVSPVRHIRDGMVENQRSKATLVLALEALCRQFPFVHYFPAYELLLDDLRDYRFYETDMIHPNEQAIGYIRDYFAASWFTEETLALNRRISKISAAARHRPLHPDTAEHRIFIQQQLGLIETLHQEFPFLNLDQEKAIFRQYL